MLYYLYEYFQLLNGTRNVGMSINAITYEEISAFNSLMNLSLSASEVDIIKMLDNCYLNHHFAQQNKKAK